MQCVLHLLGLLVENQIFAHKGMTMADFFAVGAEVVVQFHMDLADRV